MSLYESVFIARQDLSKQDISRLVDNFSAIAVKNGGRVVKTEYWGLRNLAYRINKNRKAHYAMIALEAPAAAITEMERNMRISEDVMRTVTVRVESISEQPSAIMNNSRGDDETAAPAATGDEAAA